MNIFYYEIQKLIDNAMVISDYRSKTEIDHGEQHIVPSINISDSATAKKLLEDGAAEIAFIVSGYFKGLRDDDGNDLEGYEFDVEHNGKEGCIVYRMNMPENFEKGLVKSIDRAIRSGLENFVLFRFSDMVNFDSSKYEKRYHEELDKLRSYIHRRTNTIKRTYKLY